MTGMKVLILDVLFLLISCLMAALLNWGFEEYFPCSLKDSQAQVLVDSLQYGLEIIADAHVQHPCSDCKGVAATSAVAKVLEIVVGLLSWRLVEIQMAGRAVVATSEGLLNFSSSTPYPDNS